MDRKQVFRAARDWRSRIRLGRRGAMLAVISVMYAGFAFSIYPTDPSRVARYSVLAQIMPLQAWQVVWWMAAAVALSRVGSRNDAVAFVVLETLAAVWAGGQLVTLVLYRAPGAGVFAGIWMGVLLVLRIVDGWVEIPRGYVAGLGTGGASLDPRDARDERRPGDPRDPRDARLVSDPTDRADRPRRPGVPDSGTP
jgi:hypothetical protein